MLGRARQAKTLIREHDEIFTNYGSLCMSQAWRFSAADSYAILGDLDQAQEQAWNATSGINTNIHSERFAARSLVGLRELA